uniref:acylaminoacyl-peptidase n=1 Tax=Sinocyclocheilus grahami TaxID=75366 RepID=A0A672R833_SINGR
MDSKVLREAAEIAQLYRDQCRFPALCRADVGPVITSRYGGQYGNIYTEWTQRDLERNENVKFCRQYIVFHDDKSVVYSGPSGNCTEIKGELLSVDSPSGDMKAVLRESTIKGEDKQFLEIWHKNRKLKCLNLTTLSKHGKVYEDEQFGCMVWSHSETHLLYVAEKKRPKTESYFQGPETGLLADEEETIKTDKKEETVLGQQFEYYEDWGEALVNKSSPVLCVLDIEGSNITVLEGIPTNISPGQAFWAPNDTGLVFVVMGNICLMKIRPTSNQIRFFKQLSSNSSAVCSPRLSPDLCRIVYMECGIFGPHQQCNRLCMYDWYTKQTSVVVDVVQRAREDGFTGIYSSMLSPRCWSADSQRVLMSCAQRCRKDLLVVDTSTGEVTSLTSQSEEGSWNLLNIHRDLMVVSCSSPNCPPDLRVGFLPEKGSESKMSWVTLEETQPQEDISWQTLNFSPPPEEDNSQYPGLDFNAILLKPKEMTAGSKLPLIVMPHGGPHSVLVSEWFLSTAVLCKMGFSVLLGEEQLQCLPYTPQVYLKQVRVGSIVILITDILPLMDSGKFIQRWRSSSIVLNNGVKLRLNGSDMCVFRCVVEAGYEYNTDIHLEPAILEQMLNKSPIKHVSKVKTPVLLMLGEDDKRVPNKQGIEYYRALKALQVPVRLLWYPGNNHSLSKVDAESDGFMNAALWIIQHLSL